MARAVWIALCFAALVLSANERPPVQEPPEEDVAAAPKVYSFNPLQAEKEIRVGNFYFKKGSYRAAARRFDEATRWNPQQAQAFQRLGDALTRLGDDKAARAAYQKFIELQPDSKEAAALKKRLAGKL